MERDKKDIRSKNWKRAMQEKDRKSKERDEDYKKMLEKLFSYKRGGKEPKEKEQVESPSRLDVGRTCKGQTRWSNFADYSYWLNRKPQHISEYLNKELGACGVIENSRFTLDRCLNQALIITSLNNYINRYVVCNSCYSLNTELVKNTKQRIFEVKCAHCKGIRTVRTIKQNMHKYNL